MVKPESYEEWVKGRTCESCAIFKPDTFCFVLGWSQMSDIEKSDVSNFYLVHRLTDNNADGKPQDFGAKFTGDRQRRLTVNHAGPELLMTAAGGNILYQTEIGGKSEKMLSRDQIVSTLSSKYIGKHFYVTGHVRTVLRRDGVEQWTSLTDEIQDDTLTPKQTLELGFEDIDGFSESDIYAAGGEGDVWHYNGKKWIAVDIPTNKDLYSVCCASDGNVYIGGTGNLVLRGRENQWEIINNEKTDSRYEQIVDYKGRVLAVDEWGSAIYEIKSDGVSVMDTGDFVFPPTGCLCLATGHGMLLTAGLESASVYDGKQWHSVFHSTDAENLMLVQSLLNDSEKAINQLTKDLEE